VATPTADAKRRCYALPNPALLPSKREWDEQRQLVETAIDGLRRRGVTGQGRVVGTRQAAKRILREAAALGCSAIVMAADQPRHWLIADLLWSQEPYRVRRRSPIPVHLVTPQADDGASTKV